MEVKILFTTSKDIQAKQVLIKIGKYTIEPLPTSSSDLTAGKVKYLMKFNDIIPEGEIRSNPYEDAKLFLSFFSVLIGSKLEIESSMINNVKTDILNLFNTDIYKELQGSIIELPDFDTQISELMSLDCEIAKQFLRACEVFRSAINIIGINNTLSFFLFSISIECLSNKVSSKSGGTCEKFIDFILTYLPDKSDFQTDDDWRSILKEIYYNHRSGFTHGGKSLPDAVYLADKLNRKYVKNTIDNKEIRTPSLKWFCKIVQNCLIGFLSQYKKNDNQVDYFKQRSLEAGIVKLKTTKGIQKGQLITTNDVELD